MFRRTVIWALAGSSIVIALSRLATPAFAAIVHPCLDSPENPTWILAGIGMVAAGVPWIRAKIKRRRNQRGNAENSRRALSRSH